MSTIQINTRHRKAVEHAATEMGLSYSVTESSQGSADFVIAGLSDHTRFWVRVEQLIRRWGTPSMTRDLADAALCLFDEIMPKLREGVGPNPFLRLHENGGTPDVRTWCLDNAIKVNAAWRAVSCVEGLGLFDDSFDFEFVPLWLDKCVVASDTDGLPVVVAYHVDRIIRHLSPGNPPRVCVELRGQNFELSPVAIVEGDVEAHPTWEDAVSCAKRLEGEAKWAFYTSHGDEPVMHVADYDTREEALTAIGGWFGEEVVALMTVNPSGSVVTP